jgi:hypothetical protein
VARTFLDVLLGRRPNPVDVYRAADYTLPGVMAVQSIASGSQRLAVPDLRLGTGG